MISLTKTRDFSNFALNKASSMFLNQEDKELEISSEQENNDQVDEIDVEQLALFSNLAHAWVTIISNKPLKKSALIKAGINIEKVINITHAQISANKIQQISKHNQSYVIMLQSNETQKLKQPFYAQLEQQCSEQNLRLLSLTLQSQDNSQHAPQQLCLISDNLQTA